MKSLKKTLFVGLAFVVFLGGLGFESVFAWPSDAVQEGQLLLHVPGGQTVDVIHSGSTQTFKGPGDRDLEADDMVQVKSATGVEIHFSQRGVVRVSNDAVVKISVVDLQKDAYAFNLLQGRAWVNNLYGSAHCNLLANGAYVIPNLAAVDVEIQDQKTFIYANRHQTTIGFVPLNYQPKVVKSFADVDFINTYLLPQGNQTIVYAQKITDNEATLRKLFYSKLVKEFPISIMDPQLLNTDVWFKNNIDLDKKYEAKIREEYVQHIQARGLKVSDVDAFGYSFGQSLARFYNFLTFAQTKLIARVSNSIFDNLDDAKYLLSFGQSTRAKERLNFFKTQLDESLSAQNDEYKGTVLARLKNEYDRLSFVTPDDPLAPAKATVAAYVMAQLSNSDDDVRQKFLLVRNILNSVYDLADNSSQTARQTLEDYFAQLMPLINAQQTHLNRFADVLVEENQMMDNLIHQYPLFYRDRFFAMKSQLEQKWLSLLPEGEAKNEEKQTIVSNKIDFLRQLKTYFLADKITLEDAKQVVFRLFREAEDLQLPPDQQVAVNELYAQRLQDFGIFYRYLNSNEYVNTTLHGSSRKSQFDQFVQVQNQQVSIDEVRQEVLAQQDGQPVAVPVASPEPVVAPPPVVAQPPAVSSKTELVAKILLLKQLKTAEVATSQEFITIVDVDKGLFSISKAWLTMDMTKPFSFTIDTQNATVSNLVYNPFESDKKRVDGTFPLSGLGAQIRSL